MASSIDRLKGTVKWFDVKRGFGFITPEDGGESIFVHISSIKAVDFRSILAGETAKFVVSVDDDGRKKAGSVTGPRGAYKKVRSSITVACHCCGEVGHMAVNFKSYGDWTGIGPCYNCGEMWHWARGYPATRFEPSTSKGDILKTSNLGSILILSPPMASPLDLLKGDNKTLTLLHRFSQSMDADEDVEIPNGEERIWAELPRDVLFVIFKKIVAFEVITSVQFVCRSWRQLSQEPELWRCINMMNQAGRFQMKDMESIAMMMVARSEGCVEEFYAENFGINVLGYMAAGATHLRCLRLLWVDDMTDKAVVQVLESFPRLEELEVSLCSISDEVVERIGLTCPQLKSFKLTAGRDFGSDTAFAIAKHMKQLRCLQLSMINLTAIGLSAILDNCPYLVCLDITGCFF